MVSPAPAVPTLSSTRPCFLKIPASCPSVGAWFSQLLIWPIATFRSSSALAWGAASATAAISGNALAHVVSMLMFNSSRCIFSPCSLPGRRLANLAKTSVLYRSHRGGIPPLFSNRITQYSHARAVGLGCRLEAPANSASPGVNALTVLSAFAAV